MHLGKTVTASATTRQNFAVLAPPASNSWRLSSVTASTAQVKSTTIWMSLHTSSFGDDTRLRLHTRLLQAAAVYFNDHMLQHGEHTTFEVNFLTPGEIPVACLGAMFQLHAPSHGALAYNHNQGELIGASYVRTRMHASLLPASERHATSHQSTRCRVGIRWQSATITRWTDRLHDCAKSLRFRVYERKNRDLWHGHPWASKSPTRPHVLRGKADTAALHMAGASVQVSGESKRRPLSAIRSEN